MSVAFDKSRLITVAIHTYERALVVKSMLESAGIDVILQNVNLVQPVVSSGVRLRIREEDLPLALRVLESTDACEHHDSLKYNIEHPVILVPVDNSPYSMRTCDIAFRMAAAHHTGIHILHTYITPPITADFPMAEKLTFNSEATEEKDREALRCTAETFMHDFECNLRKRMSDGKIPAIKFSSSIEEGVPEDVINSYAREKKPLLIMMGTRGAGRKERDMIGSVTAEVLDTCRCPVMTIPECAPISQDCELKNVVYFGNLDQKDLLAIDSLHRLIGLRKISLHLIVVPGRKEISPNEYAIDNAIAYLRKQYPEYSITARVLSLENALESIDTDSTHTDLIVAPNKKRNVFARFFNPSVPHRLLFHTDTPMMVVPV